MFNSFFKEKHIAFALFLLTIHFFWLYFLTGQKVALINLLPAMLFIPLCLAFATYAWGGSKGVKSRVFVTCAFILTLRLSITIHEGLIWFSWCCFFVCIGMVINWCFGQLKDKATAKFLYITIGLVVFNTLTHLSLSSPFTHTFHLASEQQSNFQGKRSNAKTWECAYEVPFFAVHCDANHFIASEKIFTENDYDPSFSVFLNRVYTGYLNSLIGVEGQRWAASTLINTFLWLLSCFAIFRICMLMGLSSSIAQMSMLSTASAWGFVSMVAQPAPYLASFAFSIFLMWITIELIKDKTISTNKYFILICTSIISVLVYEIYPIIAACIILLCLYGYKKTSLVITTGQIFVLLLWKKIGLEKVLGTSGEITDVSSSFSNLMMDINTWTEILLSFNLPKFIRFTWVGLQAFTFGNMVVGSFAAIAFIFFYRKKSQQQTNNLLMWHTVLFVNMLMLVATVFIVPQTFHWSPATGMMPRLAFFSFGVNIIALTFLCSYLFPRKLLVVPAFFFIIAQLDSFGIGFHALMFDYGKLGWFTY